MPNLEIKAPYPELERARSVAEAVGAHFQERLRQTDTYFETRSGRLKLREIEVLHDPQSPHRAELIPYLRPDVAEARISDYLVQPVDDPVAFKRLLSGILGVEVVVEKVREVYLLDNVRIHLDRVDGLGSFVELELVYDASESDAAARQRQVGNLMKALGIDEDRLIAGSYRELAMGAR